MEDKKSQNTSAKKIQKSDGPKSKQSDGIKSKQSDGIKSKQSDGPNSKQSDGPKSKQSDGPNSTTISDTKTINLTKFSYMGKNSDINSTFQDDMEELKVFSDKAKSYAEKRQVFVNLLIEFILTIKRFIELLLNRTADIELKITTFHKFLWQLKKLVLIINSHNPMKVKNNAF